MTKQQLIDAAIDKYEKEKKNAMEKMLHEISVIEREFANKNEGA